MLPPPTNMCGCGNISPQLQNVGPGYIVMKPGWRYTGQVNGLLDWPYNTKIKSICPVDSRGAVTLKREMAVVSRLPRNPKSEGNDVTLNQRVVT